MGTAIFALVCTVASWPVTGLSPATGIDPGWEYGLAFSAVHHIAWGPRLDFTYGPLGFLTVHTLYFGSTAALGLLYEFVVQFALFALLFRFTRAVVPTPIAALLTYAIGSTTVIIALIDGGDLIMGPTFLLAILAIRQGDQLIRRLYIVVISTISALGLLLKFTDGLIPLGMVVVIVAIAWEARQRILDGAIAVSSFLFVLIVAWLATGNELGDLPAYFRYTVAVTEGYSSSMQLEVGRADEWWYAAIVFLVVGGLAALRVRSKPRREKVGTALILIGYSWWALKEGFVRHIGASHDSVFFGLMFVAVAAFGLPMPQFRPFYVTAAAVVGVIAWSAAGTVPSEMLALSADTHGFSSQVDAIVDSHTRLSTMLEARTQMRVSYGLSTAMVSELAGQTVAIEPWENSVAWAYPVMHWDPEPVIQAYSAYTASLDALDSNFLDSPAAPTRMLQQLPQAIDMRNPFFDPPTTVVTAVCRYVQLDVSSQWQVLRRVPNRCGPTRLVSHQTATFGQWVRVPAAPPGSMVVARFQSLPLSIGYSISSIALKPPVVSLSTPQAEYRFLTGTAGDLHLLRGTSSMGYASQFMPTPIPSFKLTGGGVAPGRGRYEVSFYRIAVSAR